MIFSVVDPSVVIQGRTRGLKTSPSPLKQRPEWMQSSGFHTMITSPLVYFLVISFIAILFLLRSGQSVFCAPGMNWRSVTFSSAVPHSVRPRDKYAGEKQSCCLAFHCPLRH